MLPRSQRLLVAVLSSVFLAAVGTGFASLAVEQAVEETPEVDEPEVAQEEDALSDRLADIARKHFGDRFAGLSFSLEGSPIIHIVPVSKSQTNFGRHMVPKYYSCRYLEK